MDYFVELAGVPDVLEAIQRDTSTEADDLLLYDFLKDEHPTAWIAEIVHTFYKEPVFAARVWKNLRYCEASRRRLADSYLREQTRWRWKSKQAADPVSQPFVQQFATDPINAVHGYAETLSAREDQVDKLCKSTTLLPEPPAFLRTLMGASGTLPKDYDETTQRLLAHPDQVHECARKTGVAVPFSMVLRQELDQIEASRTAVHRSRRVTHSNPVPGANAPASDREAPIRRALNMDLLGLAFSGGGIRSATFNLGVLQALSKIGLLRQCDYLSTVSGGGYIGSWLAAWTRRESSTGQDGSGTMTDMQRRLSPIRSPNPMDERVRPIRFLREYSNYLTPRAGFFSADTWTMIGIYVRNTLLNQVIIVSLFGAALLLPRLCVALTQLGRIHAWVPWLLWITGASVLIVNLAQLRPPGHQTASTTDPAAPIDKGLPSKLAGPVVIQVFVVLPWVLAAVFAASYFSYPSVPGTPVSANDGFLPVSAGITVFASLLLIPLIGRTDRCWEPAVAVPTAQKPWRARMARALKAASDATIRPALEKIFAAHTPKGRARLDWVLRKLPWVGPKSQAVLVILLAAFVAGVVAAGLTWALLRALSALATDVDGLRWHAIGLGTAGLLSVFSLSIVAMLGMLGERFPDEHREWWSKLRTLIHVWALGWLIAFLAAVYVPWGFHWLSGQDYSLMASLSALAGWIASTLFGVKKGQTAEDDKKQQHESGKKAVSLPAAALRMAAHAAPFIFIVGLVFGISIAIDAVFSANVPGGRHFENFDRYWEFATWTSTGEPWSLPLRLVGVERTIHPLWTPTAAIGLLAIGLLFSWRVDINDFSIHHFYKNRLVRCYLGASHTAERQPDWFTGFDPKDDLRLQQFDHDVAPGPKYPNHTKYPGPYPILNCALNLVGGQDLAWQERKSASFVFTPKYCGYDVDRAVLTKSHDGLREDAYVPTSSYYHPGEGPLLGMAMAISGAAASPNMGRASSPALAFLMTVFNVRLGWWVGNPRQEGGVKKPSPRLGLPYTALELFGGADDRKKYVNLSDGGHFENLGVYELIRRGCRYIIVCDAGQDDRFLCEDLGNLVRQCRTDFGVEIDIAVDRIRERDDAGLSRTHCVVGKIHYLSIPCRNSQGRLMNEDGAPLLRGSRPGHEVGYLIYLKPSLTGDEAQDLLEYSRRVPEFPHQTTADQWFDESQFESYRKLGMHIGEETFGRYQDDDTKPLADLEQLFTRLHGFWYPPSVAISEHSTEHVAEYSRIMELIRTQSGLRHLDHTMFEGWPVSSTPADPRDEFYVCNALIQLIENVYADLDLEHLWNHPHVKGWMSVFERWAQQPEFQRTWQKSDRTYAERFQNFYNDRLRGRSIALPRAFVASHRGRGAAGARENTVDAFKRVIRQGASVVELDVRKLASGELVLWHDDDAGGTPVAAMTLAQLRAFAPHVMTLADCARELHGRVQLDVELKVPDIESGVLEALRHPAATWRRRDFVLTSFYEGMIEKVRALDPKVRTGLLVGNRPAFESAFKRFLELRIDFLGPEESFLRDTDLDGAAEQRVPLVPWSVNRRDRLELFLKHESVAGVITDEVELAVAVKRHL